MIFELPGISPDEMEALCIYHDLHPIIVLNGDDLPDSRLFWLFHELAHLILGESAICDDSEGGLCSDAAEEFLNSNFMVGDENTWVYSHVRHNGILFSRIILMAYKLGLISVVRLSKELGLQFSDVDELSEMLFG